MLEGVGFEGRQSATLAIHLLPLPTGLLQVVHPLEPWSPAASPIARTVHSRSCAYVCTDHVLRNLTLLAHAVRPISRPLLPVHHPSPPSSPSQLPPGCKAFRRGAPATPPSARGCHAVKSCVKPCSSVSAIVFMCPSCVLYSRQSGWSRSFITPPSLPLRAAIYPQPLSPGLPSLQVFVRGQSTVQTSLLSAIGCR